MVFGRAVRNTAGWGVGRREYAAAGRAAARTSGCVAAGREVVESSDCRIRNPGVQGTKVVSAARKAHFGPDSAAAAAAAAGIGVGRRTGDSVVGSVRRNDRTGSQSAAAAEVGVDRS